MAEDAPAGGSVEHALADRDQRLSDADQASSASDQALADRDQAAADRDLGAGVDPAAHELTRQARRRTKRKRARAAATRVTSTDQRRAVVRGSPERFRSCFDHAQIAMEILALDGCYEDVNDAFCTLVGHTRDELLGRSREHNTHPDDVADDAAALRCLITGSSPGTSSSPPTCAARPLPRRRGRPRRASDGTGRPRNHSRAGLAGGPRREADAARVGACKHEFNRLLTFVWGGAVPPREGFRRPR